MCTAAAFCSRLAADRGRKLANVKFVWLLRCAIDDGRAVAASHAGFLIVLGEQRFPHLIIARRRPVRQAAGSHVYLAADERQGGHGLRDGGSRHLVLDGCRVGRAGCFVQTNSHRLACLRTLLFLGTVVSDCSFMRSLLLFALCILRLGCAMEGLFADGMLCACASASNGLCLAGAGCAVFAIVEQTGRRPGIARNLRTGPCALMVSPLPTTSLASLSDDSLAAPALSL
jgi:hypothetical protein